MRNNDKITKCLFSLHVVCCSDLVVSLLLFIVVTTLGSDLWCLSCLSVLFRCVVSLLSLSDSWCLSCCVDNQDEVLVRFVVFLLLLIVVATMVGRRFTFLGAAASGSLVFGLGFDFDSSWQHVGNRVMENASSQLGTRLFAAPRRPLVVAPTSQSIACWSGNLVSCPPWYVSERLRPQGKVSLAHAIF